MKMYARIIFCLNPDSDESGQDILIEDYTFMKKANKFIFKWRYLDGLKDELTNHYCKDW